MKKLFCLILCGGLILSCKTKNVVSEKEIDTTENNAPKDASLDLPMAEKVKFYQNTIVPPQFDQIKISSKLNLETGTFIPTLDVTTYIEKDQKIWMNISAFLFNMARGIATPKGVKGYNRTDKTYIDSDFVYLNNLLNVNFINYNSLQKILMGRTFVSIRESQFLLTKNRNGYKLISRVNQESSFEGNVRSYKMELNFNEIYDLENILVRDTETSDVLEISYANWENFEHLRLPKNVKIIIKGSKNTEILMENTKFESSKMQTPYNVPASFKKIEIR